MKFLLRINTLLLLVTLSGCAVVKHLGPYEGKIIDAETGTPIKDAIVYVYIYTESPSPGGSVSSFAGYERTFTDKEGYFKINKLISTFRPLAIWGTTYYLIAQPEYETLTGNSHHNSLKAFKENSIHLKKLRTQEDFKINFEKNHFLPSGILPKDYRYLSVIDNIQGIKANIVTPYHKYINEFNRISSGINKNLIPENYSPYELRLWKSFGLALKQYEEEKRIKGIGGKPVSSIATVPKYGPPTRFIDRNEETRVPVGRSLESNGM